MLPEESMDYFQRALFKKYFVLHWFTLTVVDLNNQSVRDIKYIALDSTALSVL